MNEELEPEFELHLEEWEENRIRPEENIVEDTCSLDDEECLSCGS